MATTKQAKAAYQKKYNARPENKAKRLADGRARTALGLKVGDKRDAGRKNRNSNAKSNFTPQSRSANRAHGGRIGNKAGKAAGGRKSRRS